MSTGTVTDDADDYEENVIADGGMVEPIYPPLTAQLYFEATDNN